MVEAISQINSIVWSPALVAALIIAGLYFSIRTRFVQIRHLGRMFRLLRNDKPATGTGITSFEAFWVAVSGRIGSGNIIGVAMAIAFGGPGSVFWMWVIAFLGAATAFVESTLAQKYRISYKSEYIGGPVAYIEKGLKLKWLAIICAIISIVSYGILLVPVQMNSITSSFENAFSVPPLVCGIVILILFFAATAGGLKGIAKVSSVIAPVMATAYLLLALVVIALNINEIPSAFAEIFKGAFGLSSATGGIIGSVVAMGVKRGLFSNEAGQGSGAIVSASADTDHPVKQGLIQAFSIYVDTLVVCTLTALMILCTGCYNVYDKASGVALISSAPDLADNYVRYTPAAIDSIFTGLGSAFVSFSLAFFAFSTLMVYDFYCKSNLMYIFHNTGIGGGKGRALSCIYRLCMYAMLIFGACSTPGTAWTIGDIGVGLVTWINILSLLILCPKAVSLLKDFEARQRG